MKLYNQKYSLTPHQIMIVGFAVLIFIGTVLLALPISANENESIGLINALFTATSAVCVTGLTVIDTNSFSTFGQVVIMILVQIGGLGFMTFGVILAVLLGKRITLKDRLLLQAWNNSFSTQGLVRLTLNIALITMSLQCIVTIFLTLYWLNDMGGKQALYHALFHVIMAFNSAGFSLHSDSLQSFVGDSFVNIAITFLIIIGGIGFTVLLDIYQKRRWRTLSLHSKLVLATSAILTVSGFLIIFILESLNSSTFGQLAFSERLWAAWFQAVTPRSGGFNTIETSFMMTPSLLLIMLFMFIGSGTGSTGGGIKVNTFAVLVMTLINVMKGNRDVNVFKRRIRSDIVSQAIAVIMLSLGVVLLVTMLLTITERASHHDFFAILFEATSAFGTVGLSLGVTQELTTLGKIIIIGTMFVGRLGPLTFAFAMALRSRENRIRYPEDRVLTG